MDTLQLERSLSLTAMCGKKKSISQVAKIIWTSGVVNHGKSKKDLNFCKKKNGKNADKIPYINVHSPTSVFCNFNSALKFQSNQ